MLGQIGLIEEILQATDFHDMQLRIKTQLLQDLETYRDALIANDTQPEVQKDIDRKILRLQSFVLKRPASSK